MTTSKKWRHSFRVYYEDTDSGGVVYYANYLKFAERARSEILRAAGMQPSTLANSRGVVFVVVSCTCRYLRAARLDDNLTVETSCLSCSGARLRLAQKVSIASGDENLKSDEDADESSNLIVSAELEVDLALVSLGDSTCAFQDSSELFGKPQRLSYDIVRLFQP